MHLGLKLATVRVVIAGPKLDQFALQWYSKLVPTKIVVSEVPPYFLDLDAPTLPAYEAAHKGSNVWRVWCRYCNEWHEHGPAEGHRIAHCSEATSPYHITGYNLAYAGQR